MSKQFTLSLLFLGCIIGIFATSCRRERVVLPPDRPIKVEPREEPKPELPRGVSVRPQEALIKAGTFQMGFDNNDEVHKDEGPVHEVQLSYVFAIWRNEITQREFRELMGYNPSYFKNCGDQCPVEQVNWHEAAYLCNELSKKHGLTTCFQCNGIKQKAICEAHPSFQGRRYYQCNGYRLPTEAEWEYAARAGSDGNHYRIAPRQDGVFMGIIDQIAWYGLNSQVSYDGGFSCIKQPLTSKQRCGTQPIGGKVANKWGIYDMLGNVSEWVYDRFGPYANKAVDPTGSDRGRRVLRGCSWFMEPQECRISRRFQSSPSLRNNLIGFRPVRTLVRAAQP